MKVPKPRKLASGSWFIQLRLKDADGHVESVPVTELTAKECSAVATLIKAEHKAGKRKRKAAPASEVTLRQAIDKYIDKRRNTVSPLTVRTYIGYRDNRFQAVADKPLAKIKDWQAVCDADAKIYSGKSLKSAWLFIASVLRSQGIAAPKVTLPQVIIDPTPFLEPEQIPIFVKAVKGSDFEVPALLALHGFRMSEIMGLRDEDIDLEKQVLRIRGAVVPDEHSQLVRKPETKNSSSRRDVPLLIPELKAALEKLKGPIVGLEAGTIRKRINALCAAHGLPEVGLHGLRHSFASLGYHLGVSEAYMMQVGGWSDHATMRKIYTHLAQKDALKHETAMRDFFQNANENANKAV
jgi:integrase